MNQHDTLWRTYFPQSLGVADDALTRFRASAKLVSLPARSQVFLPGGECGSYLLVVSGHVHARMFTESGREFLLYKVGAGESCILTTSCLLGGSAYPAEGIADDEVTAFAIGSPEFFRALDGSRLFRDFVFRDFSRRLANVIVRMEEIATVDVDSRLVRLLLSFDEDKLIKTHQELSVQLGTAREVVSRHLKRLEHMGWIKLGRGSITLIGRGAMEGYLNQRSR